MVVSALDLPVGGWVGGYPEQRRSVDRPVDGSIGVPTDGRMIPTVGMKERFGNRLAVLPRLRIELKYMMLRFFHNSCWYLVYCDAKATCTANEAAEVYVRR